MSDVGPPGESTRIESLDVIRGFAVLGILIVNAAFFAAPWQTAINPSLAPLAVTPATVWSWMAMHVFFEFKCITLFSLLFGASLYLVGGEFGDPDRGPVLQRRLLWLAVFGLLHALLLWYGDILLTYALTGLLVRLVRSWPPRALLTAGAVLLIFSLGLSILLGFAVEALTPSQRIEVEALAWAPSAAEVARVSAAYQAGLFSAMGENARTWAQFMTGLPYLMIRTAGLMMVGMALYKNGFLAGKAPAWTYALAVASACAALAVIAYQAWLNAAAGFDYVHMQLRGMLANTALSIFVSLGYASVFVLLVKAGVRFITAPLAAVGRMAFTNYVAQSLVMSTLFWGGRGFGHFGEVDRPTLIAIVGTIWVLQLIWSPLWLSRFQMGPLEWVWRRLSYGRPVAMVRAPA